MARFYSLKKKDEDDAKTADPFGVLRTKIKTAEKPIVTIKEMAKAYVFLADGFEDIEALAPVDILRRGGVEVKTVSINPTTAVTSAHSVEVKADILFTDADLSDADLLVLPGGMPGAKNLDEHEGVCKALTRQAESGRLVGAICAAPMVLGHLGILRGKQATCYPGFESEVQCADYTTAPVTVDGNIITGKGPGASLAFGFTLLRHLKGERIVEELKKGMMYC